jgi:hypothetical protein
MTVQPLSPAGQLTSAPGAGAVVVAGGGAVGVPVGTVGRATVVVTGDVVGK